MSLIPQLQHDNAEFTAWRRELHAHPQTAFEETYASDFVAQKLTEFGLEVHRGLATTGVVGTLVGSQLASGEVRAIGLRACKSGDACSSQTTPDSPANDTRIWPGDKVIMVSNEIVLVVPRCPMVSL